MSIPKFNADPYQYLIPILLLQDHEDEHNSGTMVKRGNTGNRPVPEDVDSGTLVLSGKGSGTTDTFIQHPDEGTMISHTDIGTMIDHSADSGTMIEHGNSGTMVDGMESDMGTMVINSDEDVDDDTMKSKMEVDMGGCVGSTGSDRRFKNRCHLPSGMTH